MGLSVGLLRMTEHPGERRDFLPRLVRTLPSLGADEVVLEEGYGSAMGIDEADYAGDAVRVASRDDVIDQDVVLVLRCPKEDVLRRMRPGSVLVSMLHYATRPGRNSLLRDRSIVGVSLDSVTDDHGRRIVENLELTAWAGVEASIRELSMRWGWFAVPQRDPIRVTVLGSGALGAHAMHAATRYGDHELREALHRAGVPGVEVAVVDHDLSWHEDYMLERLRKSDLLVDATLRRDPSIPVIPNAWLASMPEHGVLLDLAADPYDLTADRPGIKGIEGVPHGSLLQQLFEVDDPAWDLAGRAVDVRVRRLALSCDAWPGVRPRDSMERYGEQVETVMEVVLSLRPSTWDRKDSHRRVRAVARAELERWATQHTG